ncbi:MAG: lysophospholipid acyltransferase family protein, partial [Chloroflexota bacterium]|nr:lysophospholipid acyltransferase family protein [Chloroflexota bacterium]
YRLADVAGALWYRAAPARAARARQNLARVSTYLAGQGRGGEWVRAAAADPAALEQLVRAAFKEGARYYLEVARLPLVTPRFIRERLLVETPEVVDAAFAVPGPMVFVGMHFGAIELPGLYLAERTGVNATVPMETLGDPELQRWFVRTRGRVGLRIVGLREARRELTAALRRGEAVGAIGDRDLTGGGIEVPLFGAPASLPIGPALLAMETGAPLYVVAVRRAGNGRYRGGLRPVEIPATGSRRERLTAALESTARGFEEAIAKAPEQWWSVFFEIWPDLPADEPATAREAATANKPATADEP